MTRIILFGACLTALGGCAYLPERNLTPQSVSQHESELSHNHAFDEDRVSSNSKVGMVSAITSDSIHATELHLKEPFSERTNYARLVADTFQPIEKEAFNAMEELPPVDVWERIARGLRLSEQNQLKVQPFIRWYMKKQDYLDRLSERARPYLYYIAEAVEARGMPTEIALLPVVESAFQPFAYSPGRAAGIWQFIPSTGRYYGLEQNWWYDGRRDVYRSTKAALNYLEKLHKQFEGDWLLALAAYNTGENNLLKAIKKNKRLGKPTDFWSLSLPRETRDYVPKLLGIAEVLANNDRYGVRFNPIPNRPYWAKVSMDSQIDLAKVAEYAGVSIEEVYRLNPGLNRWATPPGQFDLMLPVDRVAAFQEKIVTTSPEQRISWKRHRVKRGETLSHIAKRYNVSVRQLKDFNRMQSNRIRAGKAILVPVAAAAMSQYALSDMQRKLNLLNQYTPSHKRKITHAIRRGDTLWDLARRYKVSVSALSSWNKISPKDTLKPGRRLIIWKSQPISRLAINAATHLNETVALRKVIYTVKRGDSLARISNQFNLKISQLKEWNTIGKYIHPGQKLTLYVDITRQAEG